MIAKICSHCKSEKSISEFFKYKFSKDRLQPSCKKCQKEFQEDYRKRYYKEPEKLDNSIIGILERECENNNKKYNIERIRHQKTKKNYQKNFLTAQPINSYISKSGYKVLNFRGYNRLEHLWVMEKYLRRLLYSWEQVHHKNRNPLDNRIENLEIRPHIGDDHDRMIMTRLENENRRLRKRIKNLEK